METHDTQGDLAGLRVAINTQTPLVRFRQGTLRVEGASSLADLVEGEEYKLTTGGVTRMLLPLLHGWLHDGTLAGAEWIAMGADEGERRLDHDGLSLAFVGLPPAQRAGYATVKERMWQILNANPGSAPPHGEGGLPEPAWAAFDAYQARCAEALSGAADRMGGLDLLYVHDFQQIGVAQMWRGPRVPRVFHLHTPFPSELPPGWADYFTARLAKYDAVVVSTARYAENLRAAGFHRPVHVVRPFIDPGSYPAVSAADVDALRARFAIPSHERIVLNVGRMDPMKGQDRLVAAMPRLLRQAPDARLLLVGNGSFSSSTKGGLGLSKGQQWRAHLEQLAKDLGVAERVTFTGHLDEAGLAAALEACDAFALPSTREGFGLAAIEAWQREKPVVVCDRAGVSELVEDGVNGLVVDCGRPDALAEALARLLRGGEGHAMGKVGRETSRAATLEVGRRALEGIFETLFEEATRVAR